MLKLKRIGIDTYRENVAYLSRTCGSYRPEEFQALSRIEVFQGGRHILATLNIVDDETYLVPAGSEVWLPKVLVPAGGTIAANLTNPKVATPALIAIAALILMSLFAPPRPKHQDASGALKVTRSADREQARHLATDRRTGRELAEASSGSR